MATRLTVHRTLHDLQNIILEHAEAGIYVLTVNRPPALNALNAATLEELANAIARVAEDADARVLLVTGAGDKAFVAGADIAAMQPMTALDAHAFSAKGQSVMRAIEALPVPAIALVNGYALGGGCELAMACDWIIASARAVFGQPRSESRHSSRLRRHAAAGATGWPRARTRTHYHRAPDQSGRSAAHRSCQSRRAWRAVEEKGLEMARLIAAKGTGRGARFQAGRAARARSRSRQRLRAGNKPLCMRVRQRRSQGRHDGFSRKTHRQIRRQVKRCARDFGV